MDGVLTTTGATVAAVAAVQLLLSAMREWSAARRVVSVNGLDMDAYMQHGCVPTQFAGSRLRIVRAAVELTGFLLARPKTRKQAFAVRDVVGLRDSERVDYDAIRPRDRLAIMLDDGEHPAVFDRSMHSGIAGFCRTVAVRDLAKPESDARCVTVRARGILVRAADGTGAQWLEYDVTAAPPRSNNRDGPVPLAELPHDSIEIIIIPADAYERARSEVSRRHDGRLRRRLARYNPNPRVALMHMTSKRLVPLAILVGLGVTLLGWAATGIVILGIVAFAIGLSFLPVCLAIAIAVVLWLRQRVRRHRLATEAITRSEPEPMLERIPLRHAKHPSPQTWTGATTHTMSVGRLANANDARSMLVHAWQQYSYTFLPSRR